MVAQPQACDRCDQADDVFALEFPQGIENKEAAQRDLGSFVEWALDFDRIRARKFVRFKSELEVIQ